MKIKNISCTQFAGTRDKNISFTDGINVIYGKNESGKSTLVNLISRTLFQDSRLDRRKNKEFFDLYFPSAKKGSGITGDFVDGKIAFESEGSVYTLSKEWGEDPRCTLSTPDGIIRDCSKIDGILKSVLLYGEGVYSDMLFSSQRNTDISLQTILDATNKSETRRELVDAISQAFAESDGISADAIEQAIAKKIDDIAGKHWDFDRKAPARKTGGRWQTGLGEILKAYYELDDAKSIMEEISRLEQESDKVAKDYTEKSEAVRKADAEYEKFNTFASRLAVYSERRKTIRRIDDELVKIEEVLSEWPELDKTLEKAKQLQKEKADRSMLDINEAAKKINDEINSLDVDATELACPTDDEIMQVKTAQRGVVSLGNKLCGMNLNAAIQMLGDNSIEITSLRTGETIDISDGTASISEAVRIVVPGVMEMQLSPAKVDVLAIEEQIAQHKKITDDIFAKYRVDSIEALENIAKTVYQTKSRLQMANERLAMLLGGISFDKLEKAVKSVATDIRSVKDIERDILDTCKSGDVSRFITATETVIAGYTNDYGSINELRAKATELESERKKAKASVSDVADIPTEYKDISDPDAYLEFLRKNLKEKQSLCEQALAEKTSAASRLDTYTDVHPESCHEEVENAERRYQEKKSLLDHWLHIQEKFVSCKKNISNNPMQDIATHFAEYLDIISADGITSEFPEEDKLNMNIYSKNNLLDYGKLSEGTKETVSLAFRLAVLEHLFPDGDGVIIFDDPFVNMDADRTEQSCKLIEKCAERHQVIFLTCKEEYKNLLNGNNITF